jgi:hypothetical protein
MPEKKTKKKRVRYSKTVGLPTAKSKATNKNNIHIEIVNGSKYKRKAPNPLSIPKLQQRPFFGAPTTIINQLPNPNETMNMNAINAYGSMMREMRDELSQLKIQNPQYSGVLSEQALKVHNTINESLPIDVKNTMKSFTISSLPGAPSLDITAFNDTPSTLSRAPSVMSSYPHSEKEKSQEVFYNELYGKNIEEPTIKEPPKVKPKKELTMSKVNENSYKQDELERLVYSFQDLKAKRRQEPIYKASNTYHDNLVTIGQKINDELVTRKDVNRELHNLVHKPARLRSGAGGYFNKLEEEIGKSIVGKFSNYRTSKID